MADGCAASGRLVKGDRLVAINGEHVADDVQGRALAKAAVGAVAFSILRAEELLLITGVYLDILHASHLDFVTLALILSSLSFSPQPFFTFMPPARLALTLKLSQSRPSHPLSTFQPRVAAQSTSPSPRHASG